jgi:hypothetical protein
MKKIFALTAMVLLFSGIAMAQYPIPNAANSWQPIAGDRYSATSVYAILNWKPFASDSSATVYTGILQDCNKYDSITIWQYVGLTTPVGITDTSVYNVTFQGYFPVKNGTGQSQGYITQSPTDGLDTVTALAHTMSRIGVITPAGSTTWRLYLVGKTPDTKPNSKRTIVNLWAVAWKHAVAANITP